MDLSNGAFSEKILPDSHYLLSRWYRFCVKQTIVEWVEVVTHTHIDRDDYCVNPCCACAPKAELLPIWRVDSSQGRMIPHLPLLRLYTRTAHAQTASRQDIYTNTCIFINRVDCRQSCTYVAMRVYRMSHRSESTGPSPSMQCLICSFKLAPRSRPSESYLQKLSWQMTFLKRYSRKIGAWLMEFLKHDTVYIRTHCRHIVISCLVLMRSAIIFKVCLFRVSYGIISTGAYFQN